MLMNKLILLILIVGLSLIGCQDQSQNTPAASGSPPANSPNPERATPNTALQPPDQPAQPEPAPSADSDPAAALPAGLAHHNFIFKSFDGREAPSANPDGSHREPPHLSFSQWPHANGKVCNTFRGPVELKGNTLTMKNAASTMMLCADPIINELESIFYQMMSDGMAVELNQKVLTLTGGGHTLVLELSDYVN